MSAGLKPLYRLPLSLQLALNTLWHRPRKRWLDKPMAGSFLGITLSIIPLVMILQLSDSLIFGILSRFVEAGSGHIQAEIPDRLSRPEQERIQQETDQLQSVVYTYWERSGVALALFNGNKQAVQIREVPPEIYREDRGFQKYIELSAGRFDLSSGGAVLSEGLAQQLNIGVGDTVSLMTGAYLNPNSPKLTLKLKSLAVSGIFKTGYQELDRLWLFLPLSPKNPFLHPSNSQLFFRAKVENPQDTGRLEKLKVALRRIAGIPSLPLHSWRQIIARMDQNFNFVRSLLIYITYLIIAIAAVHITSSMVLLVLENSQDIAILKTLGGSRSMILRTYLWTALLLGLASIAAGFSFGLLASVYINEILAFLNYTVNLIIGLFSKNAHRIDLLDSALYLEEIPVQTQLKPLFQAALLILGAITLSAVLPAWKAAQIRPLEILRRNKT